MVQFLKISSNIDLWQQKTGSSMTTYSEFKHAEKSKKSMLRMLKQRNYCCIANSLLTVVGFFFIKGTLLRSP